jgi:hypothetical protein
VKVLQPTRYVEMCKSALVSAIVIILFLQVESFLSLVRSKPNQNKTKHTSHQEKISKRISSCNHTFRFHLFVNTAPLTQKMKK